MIEIKTNNKNWADVALVEKYVLMYDFECKGPDLYECPGGHIWHESNIVDEIDNMTIEEINELSKYGE